MRKRLSNIGASVLDKALAQYHSNKEKSIHTYLDLLDDLEYVLNDFFASAKDLKNFVKEELEKDDLFKKNVLNKYGLSYTSPVKQVEVVTPSAIDVVSSNIKTKNKDYGFRIDEILENLEIYSTIANRRIALNRNFIEPKDNLIKLRDINLDQINRIRLSSDNAQLLKNEILKFHKNKERFLYSYLFKLEYLKDVLISIRTPIQEIKDFAKQTEISDDNTRKMILQKFGLEYSPMNKLYINFAVSIYETLNGMLLSISAYRDILYRKIEVNKVILDKQIKPVQPYEITLSRRN